MKQWITPAYTFTPGGSGVGTLDLSGISSFDIKRLVAVNNITRDEVIYSPGTETSKGFTNVTGTTITLQFDTTGMNSADRLAVIYDDAQLVQGLTDAQLRATPVPVSGTVSTSSVIPGTGATNLGKAEDDPSAAGDVGVKVLGIRQDFLATVVSANGDYSCMTADRYGRNRVLVYENEVAPLGVYYYSSSAFVVQAAADAATAGRCWLINPVGSAVTLKVKRILFQCQLGSALVAVTSPRITVERVTFTGTASGATIEPSKRKTSDATNVGSLRTASTGLTLTAGAVALNFLPVASATAVAYNTPAFSSFDPVSESEIELAAGEGLVVRQADAGTAADTRRFTVHFVVMEY